MKKGLYIILVTSLLAIGLGSSAYSQCNASIPSDAEVVTQYVYLSGISNQTYWVCSGSQLKSQSAFGNPSNKTVFLESNASFSTNNTDAGDNILYAKSGSTINIDVASSDNIIYYEANVNIISAGTSPNLISCSNISFDYTNAPAGGCTTNGINDVNKNKNFVQIFPNPIKEDFYVTIDNDILQVYNNIKLSIFDVLGSKVKELPVVQSKYKLKAETLGEGIYFIKLTGKEKTGETKVITYRKIIIVQ